VQPPPDPPFLLYGAGSAGSRACCDQEPAGRLPIFRGSIGTGRPRGAVRIAGGGQVPGTSLRRFLEEALDRQPPGAPKPLRPVLAVIDGLVASGLPREQLAQAHWDESTEFPSYLKEPRSETNPDPR
jgi:hypothetical protein